MSVLKQYNPATSQWEAVVVGKQGPSGTVAVNSPLTNSGTSNAAVLGIDYGSLQYGQNYIINGAFDIWQRGTSFTVGSTLIYTADRWWAYRQTLATGMTVSQQTSGAPAGARYYARVQRDSGNTSTQTLWLEQPIETNHVIPLQGKTITVSMKVRAGANFSGAFFESRLLVGTGVDQNAQNISGTVTTPGYSYITATNFSTSWQTFSYTFTMPSNGTSAAFQIYYNPTGTAGAADYFEVTGVQLEVGSTATPFKRNAPSIQAELAACQRYYWRFPAGDTFSRFGLGIARSSTQAEVYFTPPVTMRTTPVSIDYPTVSWLRLVSGTTGYAATSVTLAGNENNPSQHLVLVNVASGLTTNNVYGFGPNNVGTAYIGFSAEL